MNKKKTPFQIVLTTVLIILLAVYGCISLYCLYKLIPTEALRFVFFIVICLGGFLLAFIPFMFYVRLVNGDSEEPKEIYIILISLFAIPIFIYGAYFVKLKEVKLYYHDIEYEEEFKYKLTAEITTDDPLDTGSNWKVYFTDIEGKRLDDDVFSVYKFDIIPCWVNISCYTHNIEDKNNPSKNVNDRTVQRECFFYFGDRNEYIDTYKEDILLYNGDTPINAHVSVKMERQYDVWKTLISKKTIPVEDEIIGTLGKNFNNLDRYLEKYPVDEVVLNKSFSFGIDKDGYKVLINYSPFLGEDSGIKLYCVDSKMQDFQLIHLSSDSSDANTYFSQLVDYAKKRYGTSSEDAFQENSFYAHMTEDDTFVYVENEPKYGGGYTVKLFIDLPEPANETTDNGERIEETWGELKEANDGTLPYDSLSEEEQSLVNYPELDENKVYWTPNGKCYHSVDWCYSLDKSKTIESGTLEEAKRKGKNDPCSKCVRE